MTTPTEAVRRMHTRIQQLIVEHGSLRAAALAINLDVGYLSRLASGEKTEPSNSALKKLGLRRVVTYVDSCKSDRLLADSSISPRVPGAWRIYRDGKLITTTRDVATLAAYRVEGCQEEAIYDEPAAPQAEPSDAEISQLAWAVYEQRLNPGEFIRRILALRPAPVAEPAASGTGGDPANPRDDSDREYTKPIGYLAAYELGRLHSGHDANLRSAKFGPSPLDADVPVYLAAAEPPQPDRLPTQEEIDNGPHGGLGTIPSDYAPQPVAQGDRPAQPTSDGRRAAAVFYSRIERTEEGLPVMTDCSVAGPWNARIEFDAGERAASRIMDGETFFDADRAARFKDQK